MGNRGSYRNWSNCIGAAAVAATAATGGIAATFVVAATAGVKTAAISGAIGAVVGASTSVVGNRISTGSLEKFNSNCIKRSS